MKNDINDLIKSEQLITIYPIEGATFHCVTIHPVDFEIACIDIGKFSPDIKFPNLSFHNDHTVVFKTEKPWVKNGSQESFINGRIIEVKNGS